MYKKMKFIHWANTMAYTLAFININTHHCFFINLYIDLQNGFDTLINFLNGGVEDKRSANKMTT